MMTRRIFGRAVLFAVVGLVGVFPVQARDEIRGLKDLKAIESKVEAVAKKVMASTVALISDDLGSSGSGVVVDKDGLILTAAHVVAGAEEVLVVFPNGEQVKGKVLGANFSKDIAMVRIVEKRSWPAVETGNSHDLEAGDWVVAMGHSAGYDASRPPPVRFGRVISLGPGTFLTTDCTLIGGDSGGPLFDLDGRVIGINSSIGRSLSNNNHAGMEGFREDWDRLLAGDTWGKLSLNPFTNPEMPVLGVVMGNMPRRGDRGVVVDGVVQGSPAAAAGVRQGDIIRTLDGDVVAGGKRLMYLLAKRKAGDEVKLGLQRDGDQLELTIKLKPFHELYGGERRVLSSLLDSDEEVPLMTPDEKVIVDAQEEQVIQAVEQVLKPAAESTVRVWRGRALLSYGTVIGDGGRVLTKWSQIDTRHQGALVVESPEGRVVAAALLGVYADEDLAVLQLEGTHRFKPVKWADQPMELGGFLAAPLPNGRMAGFGVLSVHERSLRETDKAFLGIIGDVAHTGRGVRIKQITEKSAAEVAGLQPGDIITRIGKRDISGLMELKSALVGEVPGNSIRIAYQRNGKAAEVDTILGSRPEFPDYLGSRLHFMERMGTDISQVRDSFPSAIQTDMGLDPKQVGGPVVDLDGNVVGITLARADRTRSFIMSSRAVQDLLLTEVQDPELAKARMKQQLADAMEAMPRQEVPMPQRQQRVDPRQLGHHLEQMRELMERLQQELELLDGR